MGQVGPDKVSGTLLGYVVGETTPSRVWFTSSRQPRLGEYVVIGDGGDGILGLVEKTSAVSEVEAGLAKPHPLPARAFSKVEPLVTRGGDMVRMGMARLVTSVRSAEEGEYQPPKVPPEPGSPVYQAGEDVLAGVFAPEISDRDTRIRLSGEDGKPLIYKGGRTGNHYLRIGVLASHPSVPVYVNATKMLSRHSAILAVTGAGKSNTVAIIASRLAEAGGSIILFDMHNEYDEDIAPGKVRVEEARVRPDIFSPHEIADMADIQETASNQRMILSDLHSTYWEAFNSMGLSPDAPVNMLTAIIEVLQRLTGTRTAGHQSSDSQQERLVAKMLEIANRRGIVKKIVGNDAALKVLWKLEKLRDRYRSFFSVDKEPLKLGDLVQRGKLTIVKMASLDLKMADMLVAHIVGRIFEARKNKTIGSSGETIERPVLIVLEEAHLLIPARGKTETKSMASRIAREGRKFGVSLCLVSQRPTKLDEDVLSQMNSKFILRTISPEDQAYIMKTSEFISGELSEILPSLSTGEALVTGLMAPLPIVARVDLHPRKRAGRDIDFLEEWLHVKEEVEERIREML